MRNQDRDLGTGGQKITLQVNQWQMEGQDREGTTKEEGEKKCI